MRRSALVAGITAVMGLVVASVAGAEPFDSKLQASLYNTKLVQAQDECGAATTTIGGVDACAPANVTTAAAEQFSSGKILVKSALGTAQVIALLKSSSNSGEGGNAKQLAGKHLKVRLVMRVTKPTTVAAPTIPLTWTDVVVTCSNTTAPVPSSGNFLFKGALIGFGNCNLPVTLSNDSYQKEILSAEIFDADTGKTVAVPGVRSRPPGS